jgi:hypothetical protein
MIITTKRVEFPIALQFLQSSSLKKNGPQAASLTHAMAITLVIAILLDFILGILGTDAPDPDPSPSLPY